MLLHHPSIHPSTYRWSNYGKSISFQSICACVSYYTLLAYRTSSYCFVQFLFLFYFLSFFIALLSTASNKQTNQEVLFSLFLFICCSFVAFPFLFFCPFLFCFVQVGQVPYFLLHLQSDGWWMLDVGW